MRYQEDGIRGDRREIIRIKKYSNYSKKQTKVELIQKIRIKNPLAGRAFIYAGNQAD